MATTNPKNLPEVLPEQPPLPSIQLDHGQAVVTSQQIATHFGKRHGDVIRAIRALVKQLPEADRERNFAFTLQKIHNPKGAVREEPLYLISRDGFALLAMGFTGPEALRWKLAYIRAFNLMEAKLRSLLVAPLITDAEFRKGLNLKTKLTLLEQSHKISRLISTEGDRHVRRNLYFQLLLVNDGLGMPTEPMAVLLGGDAMALLPGMEGSGS